MNTFSKKEQILKFDSINPYDFFELAPGLFSPSAMFCRSAGVFFDFLNIQH